MNEQLEQTVSSVQPSNSGNKIVIIILSVAVVILLGAVIYLLASKPEATNIADTKVEAGNQNTVEVTPVTIPEFQTYSNKEYGFEVQYPSSMKIAHTSETGANIVDPNNSDKSYISVAVYNSDPENTFKGNDQVYTSENYELNGLKGRILKGESARSGEAATTIILVKDGKYYTLQASADVFDKIVSTFKVTGKNNSVDWKIYKNEKYGFEFSYPSAYTARSYTETQVKGKLFIAMLSSKEIGPGEGGDGPVSRISVSVWNNSKQLSLVDWASDEYNKSFSNYGTDSISDFKNETLSGHKAISYSWEGLSLGKTVIVENNKLIFLLDTIGNSKTEQVWKDFDNVVSTLTFTK